MAGDMKRGGPYPPGGGAMGYAMLSPSRTPFAATRGCYSRRRLMLWSEAARQVTDTGRRFMPPAEPTAGMQPGRERPRLPRPVDLPGAGPGVAHVPAASIRSSSDSARHAPVLRTSDVRPRFTAPIVVQSV